jgi:hypothetical protein
MRRSLMGVCGLGVIALLASFAGAACSSSEDAPPPQSAPGNEASAGGRRAVRGMLGLPETPTSAPSPTSPASDIDPADVARYEAVAERILAILEQTQPGALARFDQELTSGDPARAIRAFAGMRATVETITQGAVLLDAVAHDPRFAGIEVRSLSTPGGLRVRDIAPAACNSAGAPAADVPNLGRGPDGKYGDGREGPGAAAADARGLLVLFPLRTLGKIDSGELVPDPESRLGAYAATKGYQPGSVGNAVHNAIGTIYVALGTFGEERIGRVFNSAEARALYSLPVQSPAGLQMASIEQRYWQNVATEDPYSPGGQLGAAFSPAVRDWLQCHVFGRPRLDAGAPSDSGAVNPPADGGYGGCAHDVCVFGEALGPQCSACTKKVCDVDNYCCTVHWGPSCWYALEAQCGIKCQ